MTKWLQLEKWQPTLANIKKISHESSESSNIGLLHSRVPVSIIMLTSAWKSLSNGNMNSQMHFMLHWRDCGLNHWGKEGHWIASDLYPEQLNFWVKVGA
jgi:hypothetical protein